MAQRSCCVPGCSEKLGGGLLLHRFPNPNNPAQIERFRTWVMKIGGDIIGEDNKFIHRNRKVCHKHFEDVYIFPNMKLTGLAIPTLEIPGVHVGERRNIEQPSQAIQMTTASSTRSMDTDLFMRPDSSQRTTKIMGLIDEKNIIMQNMLSVVNVPFKTHTECNNTEELLENNSTPGFMKSEFNCKDTKNKVDIMRLTKANDSTQKIQNYVHISDRVVPPRALAVLPTVLQVQRQHIISTRRTLPVRARFGPVQGIKHKISQSDAVELVLNATSNKNPLFLVKDANGIISHIETSDKDKSNWIGLLPLGDEDSANVWLYQENQELYIITMGTLSSRTPLLLGYSKKYADTYGLIGPTKDIEKDLQVNKSWWCSDCEQAFSSANQLKSHENLYHKEDKITKRRYRCKHCSLTFSRIFALRRHTARFCYVKPAKSYDVTSNQCDNNKFDLDPPILCSEDNRIPSDESFQNYSNGLDFSTNLFDTDRISSLDISGNSRSDNDFNPYGYAYKDEYGLSNNLNFSIKTDNCEKKPSKHVELSVPPCPYCKQIVAKGERRQHVSKCSGRQLICECKKVFTNMNLLKEHIWAQHSNEKINEESSVVTSKLEGPSQYKCETCQSTFKRRGMLVNHLWRIHNTGAAKVPLERRVRHYPCGTCPKVYRAAVKRDRHVQKHHPGAVNIRGKSLDGGTLVCEPAKCSACPRQYATRAKLLQHQRAHHPHLVPLPAKKNAPKPKINEA